MATSEVLIRTATEADIPHIARIHVDSWRDAYRGVIPDAAIDARTVEGAIAMWSGNTLKFPRNLTVAEMPDGQIAGFSCAGPVTDAERSGPYEFEVYALHVSPEMRRNGIGAGLLRHAMMRARDEEGMRSLIVWTLEGLRLSRRFYEREGGKLVKYGHWLVGDVELPDVAYGWNWVVDCLRLQMQPPGRHCRCSRRCLCLVSDLSSIPMDTYQTQTCPIYKRPGSRRS